MAPQTALSGLVALALLLSASVVSAFNTQAPPGRHRMHRTQAPAPSPSANAPAAPAAAAAVTDCFLTLPNNPLSAQGLSTPFRLKAPCSMAVGTQQAFAEAAIFDPATGDISIYHPLVLDAGKPVVAAPVVPTLPAGAIVALWFGFNGDTLQLLDVNGADANASPSLKASACVNGLPGVKGDIFGQVSWCNTVPFFTAVDASIAAGKTVIPPLGTDSTGDPCPSSRSFTVVDADPSDNLPTKYLLLGSGATIQDTAANRAANPGATVITNASDEALIDLIINPLIGCMSFSVPSLDDPGAKVGSLATLELQARSHQAPPVANVAVNDPDCVLTNGGAISVAKTNAYRLGVNQPLVAQDPGALDPFCTNMVKIAPPFLSKNQATFTKATTPDAGTGNNLFTFLCNRYLMSLTILTCPKPANQPVTCKLDANGAATACTITLPK